MRKFVFLASLPTAITVLVVLQFGGAWKGSLESEAITVAAAADLQFAFGEIGELFQRETGRKVVLVFGSSGTLAKQIENGAPVDIFASANIQFVDDLAAKGKIIVNSQQLYSLGRIVIASNKESGMVLFDLNDLTRPEIKKVAIANPEHAPYGVAARQALEAAGLWDQIKPKIVYGEDVGQAMQYIRTGNAEVGIVALSVANGQQINLLPIDDNLHKPLIQSIAVVDGTKQERVSREFIAFVNGPTGRPIMEKYGFRLPGSGG